ncbi:MAG: class I SAM-dependent methyltransferase [Chloroflexota bacterium]|nr:class I SAM-dependent methyltransferase [Chloroflexota bacterium]
MLSSKPQVQGSAAIQSALWGARARDWADFQEQTIVALFQVALVKAGIDSKTRLLDIGCGSGMFCAMAAQTGAVISGIDAAAPLITIARERTSHGDFRVGEMEDLPYSDKSFDVVTGFNAFQYAADPLNALQEARRVARVGAQVVAATWGKPQDCEAAAYVAALGSLMPPPPPGAPGPFALSEEGALAALVKQAGLTPIYSDDVECIWDYPDPETALKGLLSSGPASKAIQASGEQKVREAVANAIAPFEQASGSYRLKNQFRYVIAMRPQ